MTRKRVVSMELLHGRAYPVTRVEFRRKDAKRNVTYEVYMLKDEYDSRRLRIQRVLLSRKPNIVILAPEVLSVIYRFE